MRESFCNRPIRPVCLSLQEFLPWVVAVPPVPTLSGFQTLALSLLRAICFSLSLRLSL